MLPSRVYAYSKTYLNLARLIAAILQSEPPEKKTLSRFVMVYVICGGMLFGKHGNIIVSFKVAFLNFHLFKRIVVALQTS